MSDSAAEDRQYTVSFRPGDLAPELAKRGPTSFNQTARRDLARYYAVVDRELQTVVLSPEEAYALAEAVRGWRSDPASFHLLWAHMMDTAARSPLFRQMHRSDVVNLLVDRLRAAPAGTVAALVDAAERYLLAADKPHGTRGELVTRLRAAGFTIDDSPPSPQFVAPGSTNAKKGPR